MYFVSLIIITKKVLIHLYLIYRRPPNASIYIKYATISKICSLPQIKLFHAFCSLYYTNRLHFSNLLNENTQIHTNPDLSNRTRWKRSCTIKELIFVISFVYDFFCSPPRPHHIIEFTAVFLHRYMTESKLIEKCDDDPFIYNFVSSPENPLTWRIFSETLMYCILHRPTAKAMWYPTLIMNGSMFWHKLTVLVLHYLPAFLLDLGFIVTGKKLRYTLTWVYLCSKHIIAI